MNNEQPAYFITVLEKCEPDERFYCNTGGTRCWGFYYSFGKAVEALNNNYTDMRECLYDYAVIEKFYPGISNEDYGARIFFKWDEENQGFYEIEEPEYVKHLCSFSIGLGNLMGGILGICPHSHWRVINEGNLLNDEKDVLEVSADYCDDYMIQGNSLYILREHYDLIMCGKIQVVPHPYNDEQIELFQDGKKIEPIVRNDIYVY